MSRLYIKEGDCKLTEDYRQSKVKFINDKNDDGLQVIKSSHEQKEVRH